MIRACLKLNLAALAIVAPIAAMAQAPAPADDPGADGLWQRATLTGNWDGQRTRLEDAGVKLGLQEQSELWGSLAGGLRRGIVYDGLTTASVTLDLDKMGWTGASFFANAYQIHGRGPSANLIGNLQLVSSLEATRGNKLYDLWLEQALPGGALNIRLGQEGANDEMMVTQYGALFLNSSFGFPPLAANDLPSGGPNYPLATPFVRVRYQPTDTISLIGAVFNGDPAPPGGGDPQRRDADGTAFRMNDHALSFAEIWYAPANQPDHTRLPTTYKLGAWAHSGRFADQLLDSAGHSLAGPDSTGVPRQHRWDYAFYGIIDQAVWHRPNTKDEGIGVFLQVMGAPADRNLSNLFIEAGVNWTGPFRNRGDDTVGLAVSYEGIGTAARRFGADTARYSGIGSGYRGNETVVEASYLYKVTQWWMLQPDAQYVVNPGAGIPSGISSQPLPNSVILGVRALITL